MYLSILHVIVISTYTIDHEFNESEIVIRKKIITRRVKHDLKDRKIHFPSPVFSFEGLKFGLGYPLSAPSNILVFVVIYNYAVSGNRPFMITVVD